MSGYSMADEMKDRQEFEAQTTPTKRRRDVASLILQIVDLGFVAWGAMAALLPQYLLGPKSAPILPAGYEGFTGRSWQELADASPKTAGYMTLLFRTYGAYNLAFGVLGAAIAATAFRRGDRWAWWSLLIGNTVTLASAMRYDWIVRAIGPFEMSEYAGLAAVYGALAVTAPFVAAERPDPLTG